MYETCNAVVLSITSPGVFHCNASSLSCGNHFVSILFSALSHSALVIFLICAAWHKFEACTRTNGGTSIMFSNTVLFSAMKLGVNVYWASWPPQFDIGLCQIAWRPMSEASSRRVCPASRRCRLALPVCLELVDAPTEASSKVLRSLTLAALHVFGPASRYTSTVYACQVC